MRKATDLAVNHLKDELRKNQPDQELLDRLGWMRERFLAKFVKRGQQMRAQAQTPGEKGDAARGELNETLRSLGLRPARPPSSATPSTTTRCKASKNRAVPEPPPNGLSNPKPTAKLPAAAASSSIPSITE